MTLLGIPLEFGLFGLTLVGVALFHRHTLGIAAAGLACIAAYKTLFTGFHAGAGLAGLGAHLLGEWVVVVNLLGLLLGFALIARHFEASGAPAWLLHYLPRGWPGCFAVLAITFVLSGFLDNIAAALVGGALAHALFGGRVHVGYLAGLVAAANAGGAGSVLGDTTTTMIWIDGVPPSAVAHAYLAAVVALLVCGIPASRQQQAYSPLRLEKHVRTRVDWPRLAVVVVVLGAAVAVNLAVNGLAPRLSPTFPFLGTAVWASLLLCAPVRKPEWQLLPGALGGALFLIALVLAASMMPVEHLPRPSWQSTLGLGFVSAVFDNIPLTALALRQGGYDWAFLAYAAGVGGSMLWFGSSAGVALANMYPEARSTQRWLRDGWHVVPAYVLGFAALLWLSGWSPDPPHRSAPVSRTGAAAPDVPPHRAAPGV